MPNISNINIAKLTHALAAADFDLIDFVPSNLSAEENQAALGLMWEYSEKFMGEMSTFFDLCKEKKKLLEQIAVLEKKVTPGCLITIVSCVISYFLGALAAAIILLIVAGITALVSKLPEEGPLANALFGGAIISAIGFWIFFTIKLRKCLIKKEDVEKLSSLKQHLSEIQTQLDETIKRLNYPSQSSEDEITNEICLSVEHFSKTMDLLKKRDIIHKDTILSPSACLLAIEQLYNVLRQEKHNQAMEQATYNAADRVASEVARQEETNRMLNAFLAGFLNGRE